MTGASVTTDNADPFVVFAHLGQFVYFDAGLVLHVVQRFDLVRDPESGEFGRVEDVIDDVRAVVSWSSSESETTERIAGWTVRA